MSMFLYVAVMESPSAWYTIDSPTKQAVDTHWLPGRRSGYRLPGHGRARATKSYVSKCYFYIMGLTYIWRKTCPLDIYNVTYIRCMGVLGLQNLMWVLRGILLNKDLSGPTCVNLWKNKIHTCNASHGP